MAIQLRLERASDPSVWAKAAASIGSAKDCVAWGLLIMLAEYQPTKRDNMISWVSELLLYSVKPHLRAKATTDIQLLSTGNTEIKQFLEVESIHFRLHSMMGTAGLKSPCAPRDRRAGWRPPTPLWLTNHSCLASMILCHDQIMTIFNHDCLVAN